MTQTDLPLGTSGSSLPTPELYLSRLTLNLRSRDVQADLANSQRLHSRLLTAFPGCADRVACGLLFRIEPSPQRNDAVIGLVQSTIRPGWANLPDGYLLDTSLDWFSPDPVGQQVEAKRIDGAYATVQTGQVLRFRMRANPTRKVHIGPDDEHGGKQTGKHGKRVPVKDDALPEWLGRKGEQHGFRLLETRFQPDTVSGKEQRGRKRITATGEPQRLQMTHHAIVFDGVLEVTDADAFRLALWQGIGSAKAYGFGLLSIAGTGGR